VSDGTDGMHLLAAVRLGEGMAAGEGLVVAREPRGRRTLFVASERAPADFVAVDVTDPRRPEIVHRHELPHRRVRSNNLAIFENIRASGQRSWRIAHRCRVIRHLDARAPEDDRLLRRLGRNVRRYPFRVAWSGRACLSWEFQTRVQTS